MNSDTTQEDQGRLTPRRAALAAELACLPDLVAATELLAIILYGGEDDNRGAFTAAITVPTLLPSCANHP